MKKIKNKMENFEEILTNWSKGFSTQNNNNNNYNNNNNNYRRQSKEVIINNIINNNQQNEINNSSLDNVRPWNYNDYLSRLRTYKSSTWFAKPEIISAPRCSRYGWINISSDTLKCQSCSVEIQHSIEDIDGNEFAHKLINSHNVSSCGWINNTIEFNNNDHNNNDNNNNNNDPKITSNITKSGNFSPESFLYFPSKTLEIKQLEFQKRFLLWIHFLQTKPSIPFVQIPHEIYNWSKLWLLLSYSSVFSFVEDNSTLPVIKLLETQSEIQEKEDSLIQIGFWKYLTDIIKSEEKHSLTTIQATNDVIFISLLLSLFGWNLNKSQQSNCTSMYCHLCDRNVTILSESNEQTINSLTYLNPFQEHKYYCPFVSSYKVKDSITIQTSENNHLNNDNSSNIDKLNFLSTSTSVITSNFKYNPVPSGYLQYLEAILIQSIGWKETEEILKENPDGIEWVTFPIDHKRKRTSFENYLSSKTSLSVSNSNNLINSENQVVDSNIDSVETKYRKIKSVLSMVTK